MQNLLEDYLNQNPDGNYDLMELEEQLFILLENPVVISKKHPEEIDRLFFLNPIIRQNIKDHIEKNEDLISVYELQSIKGINESMARNLSRITRIKIHEFDLSQRKFKMNLSSGFSQNLNRSKAYSNGKYIGSPHRFFLRSKFQIGKQISFGFNFDKDPGENYWNRKYPLGFAHFSGHLHFKGNKILKHLILGDYKLMLGQGLLIYQGYGFGKSMDLIGNIRSKTGIKVNTSLSENFFLRGLTAEIKIGRFKMIPFVSYKRIGATIRQDTNEYFSSIDLSGSLKTESEIEKNRRINQLLGGIHTSYQGKRWNIGLNYIFTHFNLQYRPSDEVYKTKYPSGNNFHHASLEHRIHLKSGYLFGELAVQDNGGFAFLEGVLFALSQKISLLTLTRYYNPKYLCFQASAIGENSTNSNETGLMIGFDYSINRKLKWNLYVDYFLFPWIKFNVDKPSSGFEINSRFTIKWSRKSNMYFNFRIKTKEENIENTSNSTNDLFRWHKYQIRWHYNRQFEKELSLNTRIEANFIKYQNWQSGLLIYMDLKYVPSSKITLIYRLNLFTTDKFDNAVYSLERGIGTVNTFSVYSGEGLSNYLFIKMKFIRSLSINLRFSFTTYFNQNSIGSGNEEIKGNFKGNFGLQLNYQLKN